MIKQVLGLKNLVTESELRGSSKIFQIFSGISKSLKNNNSNKYLQSDFRKYKSHLKKFKLK